jgi:hypothetical protein
MPTLRYDMITAYQNGYPEHPQKVMKELGYEVTAYEGVPIGDCAMIEVKEIKDPLPSFLSITDFEILSCSTTSAISWPWN